MYLVSMSPSLIVDEGIMGNLLGPGLLLQPCLHFSEQLQLDMYLVSMSSSLIVDEGIMGNLLGPGFLLQPYQHFC